MTGEKFAIRNELLDKQIKFLHFWQIDFLLKRQAGTRAN